MNRPILLTICVLLPLLSGCNSLFSPDKAITAALANYTGDPDLDDESSIRQELARDSQGSNKESGQVALNKDARSLKTFEEIPDNGPSIEVANRVRPPLVQDDNSKSSWDKIENELLKQAQTPSGVRPRHVDTQRLKISDNDNSVLDRPASPDVIKIYDRRHDSQAAAQPVLPLIQRPLIYTETVVKTPIEKELSKGLDEQDESDTPDRSGISWRDSLEATIAHLQGELNSQQVGSDEAIRLEKSLSILRSVENDPSVVDLFDKLKELSATLPNHQFVALTQIIEKTDDRQSDLISQLRTAVQKVSQSASLIIKNVKFCTAVRGFGKFKEFESYRFKPGDEILLYCELQNISETIAELENKQVVRTCHLDAQVEFLDAHDQVDYVKSFANIKDECKTNRKDFYVFFQFKIPNLSAGLHKVQIRFTDKIGRKSASLAIPLEFEVAN